jgi:hypothetical protein
MLYAVAHCLTVSRRRGAALLVVADVAPNGTMLVLQTMFEQLVENCLRNEVYDMETGEWTYGTPIGGGH